jgi:large subunit ribosomal protein L15
MKLNSLRPAKGSTQSRKRIGRGSGSGMGGTSTRGHKGAQSRSGYSSKPGFEGGQMPLYRRVPKFGFTPLNKIEFKAINLDILQALVDKTKATVIDPELLYNNGLMAKRDKVKVLGRGELKGFKGEVKAHAFSESAIEAITKAGGSTSVI